MTASDGARRRSRKGTGVIPPNPRVWPCEHNGLDLRDDLGCPLGEALALDAVFALLPGTTRVPMSAVPAAATHLDHLRSGKTAKLSAVTIYVPPDEWLIIYNDEHPTTRVRATLMEEFFHIKLDHPMTRVQLASEDGRHRDYNREIENEAYGSGAAALVPYGSLRQLWNDGATVGDIARHFQVSPALVEFRVRITKLRRKVRKF